MSEVLSQHDGVVMGRVFRAIEQGDRLFSGMSRSFRTSGFSFSSAM
jgi:hypothetical protein